MMNYSICFLISDYSDRQYWVGIVNPNMAHCVGKTDCSGLTEMVDGTPVDAATLALFNVGSSPDANLSATF